MLRKVIAGMCVLSSVCAPMAVHAEDKFSRMVSPVSNPVNFEDPRATTEIRPIYLWHELDDKFITNGGSVQIYALQLRYAINDRLAVIANKDGYVVMKPNSVLNDEEGLGNVGGGVKYSLLKDEAAGTIATVGLTYEAPVGDHDVLQGRGDGSLRPFLSAGYAGEGFNLIGATGVRARLDGRDSSFWDADLHIDVPLCKFHPGLEVNMVHVLAAGNRLPIADEGADYFNFGASESKGETIVTGAAVARYQFTDSVSYGIAYQVPLTSGPGSRVFDWRLTNDLIVSF